MRVAWYKSDMGSNFELGFYFFVLGGCVRFFSGKNPMFFVVRFWGAEIPKSPRNPNLPGFQKSIKSCSSWWFPNQPMNEKYAHSSGMIFFTKKMKFHYLYSWDSNYQPSTKLPRIPIKPKTEIPCIRGHRSPITSQKKCADRSDSGH